MSQQTLIEKILNLSAEKAARVEDFVNSLEREVESGTAQGMRLRAREQAWRRANPDGLLAFAGEWVVLEGDELIAHGPDPQRLVAEARTRGIRVPYIFFVESQSEDVVPIGL